ncbi:hypothetical protein FHS16_006153 [Paenibacillus endophyticus]|uniref:Uncharacterized protein n=1 Tax=Paenibacillus endophyticus TaxID=1294268 RepID=A0A7W5CE58_9BACL|nr:hypothetical protein [Paenibacillus endophyticus]
MHERFLITEAALFLYEVKVQWSKPLLCMHIEGIVII